MALHPIIWVMTSPCMYDVTMHVDIHGYDTMSAENMDIYIYIYHDAPRGFIKERSSLYKGSSLWNKLPPWAKESTSLNDFKHNFRFLNGWIHPEFIVLFICTPILYAIFMLLFSHFCLQLVRYIHIRNFSQFCHDIVVFMYDLYLWMRIVYICVPYIYVFYFVTGAAWKNSVTEWSTLYKINYPYPTPTPLPPFSNFPIHLRHPLTSNPGSALVFILDLTPGFNGFGKDNCKARNI